MNSIINLKCDVCGSIIQTKIQAGWLEKHPIRITCGKCKISINGEITLNQNEGIIENLTFKNAHAVEDNGNYDYYIGVSGELLTFKLENYDKTNFVKYLIPPFFHARWAMSEGNELFKRNVIKFLYNTKSNWHKYSRIFELANNKNYEYLENELLKISPNNSIAHNNLCEYNKALHQIISINFNFIFTDLYTIENEISTQLLKLNRNCINNLIDFLKSQNDILSKYQIKIHAILDKFINIFQYLIPAYGIYFYEKQDINYTKYGVTTTSFEDIKQFYSDCYETLGDIMMIPIGLNNIKYRNDFEKNSLPDNQGNLPYSKLFYEFKGTRLKYMNISEIFSDITELTFNNKLRNAIGHNNYDYDGITQQITYIPNEKKIDIKEHIYLLQFSKECLELFKTTLLINEIIFHLKNFEYINNGSEPPQISAEFKKNIGRNMQCPCGSGKKFKNCCGKNQ